MTTYTITLCGDACIDQDYITQPQWDTAFSVGTAFPPFDIYGVRGFVARTPIVGSHEVICPTVSYCWGPEEEGEAPVAAPGVFPFRWKAVLANGLIHYGRTDGYLALASASLFPDDLVDAASLSMCFDFNGLPVFVVGFKDGHCEVRRFTNASKILSQSTSFTGATPQLWFVGLLQEDSYYWDVVCYYMLNGVLTERIQRDSFEIEYEVVSGLTGWNLKHTDRGSGVLSSYHLMEIHSDSGGKAILSVQYGEPTPSGEIVSVTNTEYTTATLLVGSDMVYSEYVAPESISGGTQTETTGASVVISSDMVYSLSLPVTPVAETETTGATISIASDMVYSTVSLTASGSEAVRSFITIASDMDYLNPTSTDSIWHTTPPTGLTTEQQKAKACLIIIKARALKDYTYSPVGDGGAAALQYRRADQIVAGQTWAYVSEAWQKVASDALWTTTPEACADILHQQNILFTNYTFNAGTKTFTFTTKSADFDFDASHPEDLYEIRNVTKNLWFYLNVGATITNAPVLTPYAGLGGTWTGNNLVLETDLTGKYDAGDILTVYGNVRWTVDQGIYFTNSYTLPVSWVKPVIIANPAYANTSMSTAPYTFTVAEARSTRTPAYAANGLSHMFLSNFVTQVGLP